MQRKREFRIEPVQANRIAYSPLVDKHLEYYFASGKNRSILVKTKVVNRRNEIIDRDLCRMIDSGLLNVSNQFRLKKSRPKLSQQKPRDSSGQPPPPLNQTVGKKQFQKFLESQRAQLRNHSLLARTSQPEGPVPPVPRSGQWLQNNE